MARLKKTAKTAFRGPSTRAPLLHSALNLAGPAIDVGSLREGFGVSQEEFARVTRYSTRSIAGWESGGALSDAARQKLMEAERLRQALAAILPGRSVGQWLRAPNRAFEGQTPLQVIERGESDRI